MYYEGQSIYEMIADEHRNDLYCPECREFVPRYDGCRRCNNDDLLAIDELTDDIWDELIDNYSYSLDIEETENSLKGRI